MKRVSYLLLSVLLIVCIGRSQQPANSSATIHSTRLHPALLEFSRAGSLPSSGFLEKTGEQPRDLSAVIYTTDPDELARAGVRIQSRYPGFVTAMLRPSDVQLLEKDSAVTYARPGRTCTLDNDLSRAETGSGLLHSSFINNTSYKGKGAIVLVYDTGIDWKHLDFRNPADSTKSRILFIWDQTLTAGTGENPPSGFTYGVEYTQGQIQNEIDGTPAGIVREKDINGHGTHVSGTAAGNGITFGKFAGEAPEADIIVVKGGDGSFSDADMVNGLKYATNKAVALGKPMVVNWSLGSMWGPHDASDPNAVAIDEFCSQPGRVHVNSAGNSGNSLIHVGGNISAGGSKSFTITVPTYTPSSGRFNDVLGLILWFNASDTVTAKIEVTTPTSKNFQLLSGETVFGDDADGRVTLGNTVSPDNNQRMFYLTVEDADSLKVPKAGTWTVTLSNAGKAVAYDGWLDPLTIGGQTISLSGADVNKTVNSFVANKSIMVGSYFTRYSWPQYYPAGGQGGSWTYNYDQGDRIGDVSPFSSRGPARDGRIKPDIASPGQYILSVLSSNASPADSRVYPKRKYQVMQGTSMAAPNVTGCVALILAQNPTMTADQVKNLLAATAVTDAYTGTVPNNTFGAGKINVYRAFAKMFYPTATTSQTIYRYDKPGMSFNNSYMNYTVSVDSSKKYALRFTPTTGGRLASVFCNLRWMVIPSGASLACEVYTSVTGSLAGIPGTKIGNTVQIPLSNIDYCTTVNMNMLPAGVTVNAGTDYHVVLSLTGATGSDGLDLISDDGSANADNRSSRFSGGVWLNSGAGGSGLSGKNIRVRPVVVSSSVPLAVGSDQPGVPATFELSQNYPNPFNPTTTIAFRVAGERTGSGSTSIDNSPLTNDNRLGSGVSGLGSRWARLAVYDILGREVALLVNGELEAGAHTVEWDASDVASGVYFYRLEAGGLTQSKKMLLLR